MTVVVIGGGVAGLVAARTLLQAGMPVRLLEASPRFGGALRSATVGGVSVDIGAEAFAVTRPEARELIDDLGLSATVVRPRRSDARVLLDTGLFPMPHALLGIPTDLGDPEVVAIIGTGAAIDAVALDSRPVPDDLDPGLTLGRLVRQRMGDAVVERIVRPVVGGVHAIDPDLVEADAVVPGLLRALHGTGSLAAAASTLRAASGVPGAAIAGLRGGMTALVAALVDDLRRRGAVLETDVPVSGIQPERAGWTVRTPTGAWAADAVVLAVDAPRAAALLERSEGTREVRDRLAAVSVGDVAVVAAVVASPSLDADPVGSGVLIPPGVGGLQAKAMTHASAKWDWIRESFGPGRHLVRLSYGRDGHLDEDLAALPEIARRDLELITGTMITEFEDVAVARWAHSLVHQRVGHRENVAALRSAVAAQPTLAIAGAGIGGNGLAGTIAQARTVLDQLSGAALPH